jgi:hypothetical protein
MVTRELTPHLVHTQFLANKQKWTAFTTWRGMDLYEIGETERNAIYFLLSKHTKFLGVTESDIDNLTDQILKQ